MVVLELQEFPGRSPALLHLPLGRVHDVSSPRAPWISWCAHRPPLPSCGTVALRTSSKPLPQCRLSPACGRTSSIGAGREAAGAPSSSGVIAKYCAPAASGGGGGGGHHPGLGRVVHLAPLPLRSWPSSVPLRRRGGSSRPGASRRLAVHAS